LSKPATITKQVRNKPQQDRSRETEELILRSVEEMIKQGRDAEDIKVAEIALECGLTTGAIYSRFRNKDAVMESLIEATFLKGLREELHPALSPEACKGKSIREIIHGFLTAEAKVYRTHAALGRFVTVYFRMKKTKSLTEIVAINERTAELLRARLDMHRDKIGHPDPDYAIDLADHATDYTLVQKICFEMPVSPHSVVQKGPDKRIVDELTDVFVRYLQVDE